MADKQPTFAERVKRMEALANDLTAMGNLALKFGEELGQEAYLMKKAAERFAERNAKRTPKAER